MASFGVGSAVTGHGADLEIIDDAHKEGDEQSQAALDGVYDWFVSAVITRLHPRGRIVIPCTRWSDDDIIGQLTRNEDSHKYHVVRLPALAEADDPLGREVGQALWEERYPVEELEKIRALSESSFQALFQQNPQALVRRDFDVSKVHLVCVVDYTDMDINWFFDLAITEKTTADYTAMARVGLRDGKVLVEAPQHYREEWPVMKKRILQMMIEYPEDNFVFERRTLELMAVQDLKSELDYTNQLRIVDVPLDGDKIARAQSFVDRMNSGHVYLKDGLFNKGWLEEHRRFPSGHDDWVDVSSLAMNYYGLRTPYDFMLKRAKKGEKSVRLPESVESRIGGML